MGMTTKTAYRAEDLVDCSPYRTNYWHPHHCFLTYAIIVENFIIIVETLPLRRRHI
jgi:hypothetical protein